MGSVIRLAFNNSNDSLHFGVHSNSVFFLVKAFNGLARSENLGTKLSIVTYKAKKLFNLFWGLKW